MVCRELMWFDEFLMGLANCIVFGFVLNTFNAADAFSVFKKIFIIGFKTRQACFECLRYRTVLEDFF